MAFDTATLPITPEILSLIAEIDEFKGAWRAIGRIAPNRLSGLRRVATIESIGSSTRIEGARLSDREVESLLANIRIGSFSSRDEQEVAGYAEVMETVFNAYDAIPLTENHIRQLHRDLLVHSTKDERHRGSYKTSTRSRGCAAAGPPALCACWLQAPCSPPRPRTWSSSSATVCAGRRFSPARGGSAQRHRGRQLAVG